MLIAFEIKEQGLNLAYIQMMLLKKIEELTLYTVQQARQLRDTDAVISSLSASLTARGEQGALHDARLAAL